MEDYLIEDGLVYSEDSLICHGLDLKFKNKLEKITIKEGCTTIAPSAFDSDVLLQEVVLPSTLRKIEKSAFKNSAISKINFPDNLATIEALAFSDCQNLTKINLSNTKVEILGGRCFSYCLFLKEVLLPNTLKQIKGECFYRCPLRKIVLPELVTRIESRAFMDCAFLEEIVFPINAKNFIISPGVFEECTNLEEITLPINLERISACMFKECENLKTITNLKDLNKLIIIETSAFENCTNLKRVTLPRHLKQISYDCFRKCKALTKIENFHEIEVFLTAHSNKKSSISHLLEDCSSLKEILISNIEK